MKYNIGKLIKTERKKHGWDQAELVRRLGGSMRQQAISGWERGASRPTRETIHLLSKEFEIEEKILLENAGYINGMERIPRKPVRPLLTTLPIADLTPYQFEQFSADLASCLNPEKGVSIARYGSTGHKQEGADIIVTKSGHKKDIYQCKRVNQFGPAAIKKAVDATNLIAENYYLLLTRVATPQAREEIQKYEKWILWDIEDISQRVRELPVDKALRLVETYFPGGWREQFLGIDDSGPWTSVEDFYRRFNGDQIFSHTWGLVGQEKIIDEIKLFYADDQQKLGVISGRGGSGKTRLLRELAKIAQEDFEYNVRFLGNGQKPTLKNYELLRDISKLLIIVDDAHERSDIAQIIDGIHGAQPEAKIILALRPYGFSQLSSDLRRIGVHPSEFPSWEIQEIKFQDAEKLTKEVLGDKADSRIVSRIAYMTKDCPLLTVVGAGLFKRGELDVLHLESDDQIKEEILSRFRDTFIESSSQGDSTILNTVLNTISALQPFPLNDPDFRKTLEKLSNKHWDELIPYIRRLEEKGILLKRGNVVRIVPDLLGDVILAEACFDNSGSTGYIERLFSDLSDIPLQHLIINTARVDWQVNTSKRGQSLVGFLWPKIISEFKSSDWGGRLVIMKLLKKVAFFQPEQTLSLVNIAMTEISEDSDEKAQDDIFSLNNEHVMHAIPEVLKQVAYNFDFLKEAADLLWELARKDDRRTNSYPDHPIRILQDLASYSPWKPAYFNEKLADIAINWLEEEKKSLHSPFDILETLLATESSETLSEGSTLTFRPFAVRLEAVQKIRNSILHAAFLQANTKETGKAARAVNAISKGISYPMGMFNRIPSEAERSHWTPYFVKTISELGELARMPELDPTIALEIRKALQWHRMYSKTETKNAALKALKDIPEGIEHQMALALHSGWGDLVFERIRDFKLRDERRETWYKELAENLGRTYSDQEIVDLLEGRLNAQKEVSDNQSHPGPFMWVLIKENPSIGKIICEKIIENNDSVFLAVLPVVLSQMMENDSVKNILVIRKLVATENLSIIRSVVHAFGWNRGGRDELNQEEFDILCALAKHSDQHIRSSLIRVVHYISSKYLDKAIKLVSLIEFGDSLQVASEVFSVFGKHGVIKLEDLSSDEIEKMWQQLKIVSSIDDHSIMEFLLEASEKNPDKVLELLKGRIEYGEVHSEIKDFNELPFHWDGNFQFREHPNFNQLLRDIRDWMAERPDSWVRMMEGAKLFQNVSGEFDDIVIGVLEEVLYSGTDGQLEAVSYILREAPKNLVLENPVFVERVLEIANNRGGDKLRNISFSLISAVENGVRSGTLGEPFQADVEQKEKALRIAESLVPGTLVEKFYRTLAESAERNMNWHAESNEKMQDSREW